MRGWFLIADLGAWFLGQEAPMTLPFCPPAFWGLGHCPSMQHGPGLAGAAAQPTWGLPSTASLLSPWAVLSVRDPARLPGGHAGQTGFLLPLRLLGSWSLGRPCVLEVPHSKGPGFLKSSKEHFRSGQLVSRTHTWKASLLSGVLTNS